IGGILWAEWPGLIYLQPPMLLSSIELLNWKNRWVMSDVGGCRCRQAPGEPDGLTSQRYLKFCGRRRQKRSPCYQRRPRRRPQNFKYLCLAFSLRKRDWVRRTERFGRSLYLCRGLLRRSYFFLIRLTARGSRRPGRSGNLSAAKASSNLSHNSRRFFFELSWLMA